MTKLIQSLLFISLTLIYSIIGESELPFNPLDALKWNEINLLEQIQDEFKMTESDGTTSSSSSSFTTTTGINLPFQVRRLDGLLNHPNAYGATNSRVQRCMDPVYADGISQPNGECRMNPREISNVLSKQTPEESNEFLNDRFLTQFAWQWGQFIDHDVTLISEDSGALDETADIDIYVPCNDPEFDMEQTCDADNFIQVFRTHEFPGSGDSATNPRAQLNEITSFIDASMIYGSDDDRAGRLRSDAGDGKLLVTEDDFLPRNSGGIHNEPNNEEMFVLGGDVRTNEVSSLLTMHTIWVRFHNIIAEEVAESLIESRLAQIDSDNYDEMIYQFTKLIVTAIVQKITYTDWLPTMFGPSAIAKFLGDYNGYDETVNPSACLMFSSAAFRFGHTLLPEILPLREQDCKVWELIDQCENVGCDKDRGGIDMRNSFFVPQITEIYDVPERTSFMDAILNGFSCTLANEVDVSVTDAVRNFLFESSMNEAGERTHGNLDLMAINIQRGREHGLPDYNSVREHVGLNRLNDFDELTDDTALQQNLQVMYGDIDDVDLFLGLLAEDHLEDGSFGATLSGVVLKQFARFRDGDRFWYQRYIQPGELLDFINCISLKQVIELTTGITNIDALDSIRHNLFQNRRAISVFAGTDTFAAQSVSQGNIETNIIQQQRPNNDNNNNKWNNQEPNGDHPYIIQLTNMQIFIIFAVIMVTIGCTCYTLHECKKNKMNRYRPVKYDTETDTEASDREKLQA